MICRTIASVDYIVIEMVQKEYKSRHGWVEKVIHWELCKWLKFGHAYNWYRHTLESVVENSLELWDTNRSPNPGQKKKSSVIEQEENNLVFCRFCC